MTSTGALASSLATSGNLVGAQSVTARIDRQILTVDKAVPPKLVEQRVKGRVKVRLIA